MMVWSLVQSQISWSVKPSGPLGSTEANKVSGSYGFPIELFRILKDDAIKVLHSICQQICKNPAVATGLEKANPLPNS